MRYRQSHYHHHHHHYEGEVPPRSPGKRDGFIKTTIRRLAEAFDVPFKFVVLGFIVLFLFTGFFALFVFLVASHWVRHPQKYDAFFDKVFEKTRRGFRNMSGKNAQYESPTGGHHRATYGDSDLDFSDLDRKFEDLKRRTSGMEEHVSSDEHKLNTAFKDLK